MELHSMSDTVFPKRSIRFVSPDDAPILVEKGLEERYFVIYQAFYHFGSQNQDQLFLTLYNLHYI
jgi:hypothetical protein